jgi:hypothetical protein
VLKSVEFGSAGPGVSFAGARGVPAAAVFLPSGVAMAPGFAFFAGGCFLLAAAASGSESLEDSLLLDELLLISRRLFCCFS